jgi:hypothetical protein
MGYCECDEGSSVLYERQLYSLVRTEQLKNMTSSRLDRGGCEFREQKRMV